MRRRPAVPLLTLESKGKVVLEVVAMILEGSCFSE